MTFDPATVADGATLGDLGWVLLHFLWQGALLGALFWGANFLLRHRTANARYLAGCVTLLLMAAAPLVTFGILRATRDDAGSGLLLTSEQVEQFISMPFIAGNTVGAGATPPIGKAPGAAAGFDWGARVNAALPWVALGWMLGTALMALRQLGGWLWLKYAVRNSTLPVREHGLEELAQRVVGRPVRFLESALVQAPATLGVLRPIILLPVSAMTGLSQRQLEAILAHELAHIRRWDYFVNMAQAAIEAVLFFHPAVWWVSRRVRRERENCCDDIAVAVVGDRTFYASALETLERLQPIPTPQLALGAAGAGRAGGGELLVRIGRLLGVRPYDLAHVGRGAGVFWAMACGIVLLLAVELLAASGSRRAAVVPLPPASIASAVYDALQLPRGGGDPLAAIATAIPSAKDDEAALRVLADQLNSGGDPDALARAIFARVRADSAIAYQSSPDWSYGNYVNRYRLVQRLVDHARDADMPDDQRQPFARAALALSAQDAAMFGLGTLRTLLDAPVITRAAGLTDAELADIRAALARHAETSRAATPHLIRARQALSGRSSSGSTRAAVAEINESLRAVAPLAHDRPDLQWHLVGLAWQYQARANNAASAALVADLVAAVNAPHFARWMAETANKPVPPARVPVRITHEELLKNFKKITLDVGERRSTGSAE